MNTKAERVRKTAKSLENLGLKPIISEDLVISVEISEYISKSEAEDILNTIPDYDYIITLEDNKERHALLRASIPVGTRRQVITSLPSRIAYSNINFNEPAKWQRTLDIISNTLFVLGLQVSDLSNDLYITRSNITVGLLQLHLNKAKKDGTITRSLYPTLDKGGLRLKLERNITNSY
jgi:hypothetical protein